LGTAHKIVKELDWSETRDLNEDELGMLVETMKEHPKFQNRNIDTQMMLRQAQEIAEAAESGKNSKNKGRSMGFGRTRAEQPRGTNDRTVDLPTLKEWFEREEFTEADLQLLLKMIIEKKPENKWKAKDKIDALDLNKWRTAIILEVKDLKILIHFEGWDKKWDTWLHIVKDKDKIKPYGEETKGAWTGQNQSCPYINFNAEAEDFKQMLEGLDSFEEKYSKGMEDIKDQDVEYLLMGNGVALADTMLKARPIDQSKDGTVPAEVISRYLRNLTVMFKTANLHEKKIEQVPQAGKLVLDRILQILGGDENLTYYYYENGPQVKELPGVGKFAKKIKNMSMIEVNLVNQFGADGGFDEIKNRVRAVAKNEKDTPLPYSFAGVSRMIKLVSKLKPSLRSEFLEEYTRELDLFNLVEPALSSLDENGIRSLETSDINNLGKDIKSLTSGLEKANKVHRFIEETELSVIKLLLKVDQLPKKMDALKFLGNIIRALDEKKKPKSYGFSWWPAIRPGRNGGRQQQQEPELKKLNWIQNGFFLQWLQDEKIVESILQANSHQLVIQLSVPILKFLASNKRLTKDHLKTLSTLFEGADSETSKVISAAIANVAEELPENQLRDMYSTFTDDGKKELKDYTLPELKLIGDFTTSAIKATGGKGNVFGVNIFWDMLQGENQPGLTPETVKLAKKLLKGIFISDTIKEYGSFIKRCVKNLEKGKSVVTSLELLSLMLESPDPKTTCKSILKIGKDYRLLSKFFEDYKNYNTAAYLKLEVLQKDSKQGSESENLEDLITDETILHGSTPHSQQISSRLEFLQFLIQNSTLALTKEDVDSLWSVCVTESVIPDDIAQFMRWLSNCMLGKGGKLNKVKPKAKGDKSDKEERKIYDAFDAKSSASMFSKLEKTYKHAKTGKPVFVTPEWYSCFANTFISTNKKNGAFDSNGYVKDYDKIRGRNALWNFALREPNPIVRGQAQKFLVSAHIKLDINMKGDSKIHVLKCFLEKCSSELSMQKKAEENKNNAIVRDSVMTVLGQLLRRVEKGEMVIRPLFKVNEKVCASWKRPATPEATLYNATVMKVNTDGDEITYSLHYADGDKDPAAKEINILTKDRKVKVRPPLVLSDAEKFPALYLSGEVKGGEKFLDLAIDVMEKGGQAGMEAWELLKILPYNKQALSDVVKKLPHGAKEYEAMLPAQPERLLYILTVLDPNKAFTVKENPLANISWCAAFIKGGALSHLVKILGKFDPSQMMKMPLRRLCLSKLLNLICYFLTASECQVRVSVEDVSKAVNIKEVLNLCMKFLLLAVKAPDENALKSLLTTAVICSRMEPKLISDIPRSAPWNGVFAAALIENENVDVQSAFTKGMAELCEHSIELPAVYRKPTDDSKGEGKNDDDQNGEKAGENNADSTDSNQNNAEDKKKGDERKSKLSDDDASQNMELHLDIHRLFLILDLDKNKELDPSELHRLFYGGKPFPPGVADGVDSFIAAADENKNGKISFNELSNYFKAKKLTSLDLAVTYQRISEIKRGLDAKNSGAKGLRQGVRSHFLPILLSRFTALDTKKDCAQFLTLMGALIRQSESIEASDAKKIAESLAQLIKSHPMRERNSRDKDAVLGAFMTLTAETINKAPFLRDNMGVKGTRALSLLQHVFDCLFATPSNPNLDLKDNEVKSPKSRGDSGLHPPKCKHPDSRKAGFQLLLALVKGNDANLEQLVKLLTKNHLNSHSDGKRPEVWNFEPPKDAEERGDGFVGLRNCGNTCYINAALQQVFMMKRMRKELLKVDNYDREGKKLLFGTQWLLSHLQESASKAIVPKPFLDSYIDPATGKPVRAPGSGCRQDDSFGFFQTLLSRLEDETKGTPFHKTIPKMMGVTECTEMIGQKETPYLSDHKAKHRNRVATTIQVNVTGLSTLEDCLGNYVKGEQISGYSGASDEGIFGQSYPGKKITILKRTSFKHLPNTLAIGLNRMRVTWDEIKQQMSAVKEVHRISFPFDLDMKPYCIESLACPKGYRTGAPSESSSSAAVGSDGGGGNGDSKSDAKSSPAGAAALDPESEQKRLKLQLEERKNVLSLPPRTDNYYKYRLMGVIVHSGQTLNSGHYYSFIRERPSAELKEGEEPPKDGEPGARWYCFNDSSVTPFNHKKLGEETFGAKDGSWKSATAYVVIYERIKLEKEEEPETKNVSTEILERIWHENRIKVADTNVFNIPYFLFLQQLGDHLLEKFNKNSTTAAVSAKNLSPKDVSDNPTNLHDATSRLMLRFMFKTLARSHARPKFWQGFVELVNQLLEDNVATSTWFLSMLVHPTQNWWKELVSSPIETVNESTVQLFARAAKTISPLEKDSYLEGKSAEVVELKGENKVVVEEVMRPKRGFVVQAVDQMLAQLESADSKEASSLIIESLANFASFGGHETKYLQSAAILKHMMSALTCDANAKHNLGDAIFTLLNTVKKDLNADQASILLSSEFMSRLVAEAYTVKRGKGVVDIICFLCSSEGAKATMTAGADAGEEEDASKEAKMRLDKVLQPISQQLRVNHYETTRPFFRVLNGLLSLEDKLQDYRVDKILSCILRALGDAFMDGNPRHKYYRKTEFLMEHLLRMCENHQVVDKVLKSNKPELLNTLVEFFNKYPSTKLAMEAGVTTITISIP